jgi:hypothetical protein
MKSKSIKLAALLLMFTGLSAYAGTATSSAGASSGWWGPGTAEATAGYSGGGVGFARTDSDSGRVSRSRGLAFGVDEDGMSLSSSYAVAPKLGPAVAGTFNLAVGTDGSVSRSVGRTTAYGSGGREVSAGGFASPGSYRRPPAAGSTVHGRTGPLGRVFSHTDSSTYSQRRVKKVGHRIRKVRRMIRFR